MLFIIISSCTNGIKGADARKIPANMTERQRQNIEEGRGLDLQKEQDFVLFWLRVTTRLSKMQDKRLSPRSTKYPCNTYW